LVGPLQSSAGAWGIDSVGAQTIIHGRAKKACCLANGCPGDRVVKPVTLDPADDRPGTVRKKSARAFGGSPRIFLYHNCCAGFSYLRTVNPADSQMFE